MVYFASTLSTIKYTQEPTELLSRLFNAFLIVLQSTTYILQKNGVTGSVMKQVDSGLTLKTLKEENHHLFVAPLN